MRRQVETPRRFGRILARWANMPTSGQSGFPRGRRAPDCTSAGSTRWNWKTTTRWEKAVETGHRVGPELRTVEADHRIDAAPVVVDRLGPATDDDSHGLQRDHDGQS